MHYYQHMGYSIIYHQRIAVLSYFFHSGIFLPISVFIYSNNNNPTSPHLQKLCQVLPTFLKTRKCPVNRLPEIHSSYHSFCGY